MGTTALAPHASGTRSSPSGWWTPASTSSPTPGCCSCRTRGLGSNCSSTRAIPNYAAASSRPDDAGRHHPPRCRPSPGTAPRRVDRGRSPQRFRAHRRGGPGRAQMTFTSPVMLLWLCADSGRRRWLRRPRGGGGGHMAALAAQGLVASDPVRRRLREHSPSPFSSSLSSCWCSPAPGRCRP